MKRFFGFALLLVLFSVPAFASKNSDTLSIPSKVTVGTTQIPAGSYKLTWTGSGSDVQLTLAKDGKTLVIVPAKVVAEKNGAIGVVTSTESGAEVLRTINLSKMSLVISDATVSGQ
jgi:hypothetical protein